MPDQSGLLPPYLDPSQYPAYLDLQRKQQLAQMLMQNTQQMSQTPPEWNSMRVVPRRSVLSNVATLASALASGYAQNQSLDAQKNYFKGMYGGGGGQPQGGQPAPSPNLSVPTQVTPSAGGTSTQFGDTPPAPGLVPPQAAPQQAPQGNNPRLLVPGDIGMSQTLLGMMGPQEYGKALAGRYAPTDLEKIARAAGANDQQIQSIMQANIAKQNYIAPIEEREGSVERNPLNNAVIGENPKTPLGAANTYNAQGQLTGQQMTPGSQNAIAQSAAASTAGSVSQTPQKIGVDKDGRDVFVYPKPPAMANSGGAQAPKVASPSSSAAPATASAAVLAAQREGGLTGQQYSNELAKNATGATEVRRSLSELKNLASQATPGAANESKMKMGSYMIAAGADPNHVASWLGVNIGALQAAQKQTATLAVNTIHSMTSRGTNFDLDTFMRNNPNLNMSDPSAFNRVVDYMDNKSKQEIAKQADFVQWKKQNPSKPEDWEAEHTAHWLSQQNQSIDQGQSNSRSTAAPVTKSLGGKTYVQQNGKWYVQ